MLQSATSPSVLRLPMLSLRPVGAVRWNTLLKGFTLGFSAFLGLGLGSHSWAVTPDELRTTWATGSGRVSSEDWSEMISLFREDDETNAILGDIQRKLGASRFEDIARIVELCPSLEGNTQGRFSHKTRYFERSQSSGTITADFGAEARAEQAQGVASRVERRATMDRLTVASVNQVCIRPGLSVLDAFGVLVHELTHFRGWEALKEVDVLDYRDEHEFAEREVLVPGGELEAYTAQGRALCRLEKRTAVASRDTLMRYFDSDCNLSDRAGLVRNILDSRGYRQSFEREFRNTVSHQKSQAARSLEMHRNRLLPIAEQNAEIPGANQAFNQDYVVRIRAEIQRLERRIEDLDRRFPSL